jgi:hypothetical protein
MIWISLTRCNVEHHDPGLHGAPGQIVISKWCYNTQHVNMAVNIILINDILLIMIGNSIGVINIAC